jgi:hypothetical protein
MARALHGSIDTPTPVWLQDDAEEPQLMNARAGRLVLLRHEFSVLARCAVSRGKGMTTRTSGQIFNER